jgi:hypothetical protein
MAKQGNGQGRKVSQEPDQTAGEARVPKETRGRAARSLSTHSLAKDPRPLSRESGNPALHGASRNWCQRHGTGHCPRHSLSGKRFDISGGVTHHEDALAGQACRASCEPASPSPGQSFEMRHGRPAGLGQDLRRRSTGTTGSSHPVTIEGGGDIELAVLETHHPDIAAWSAGHEDRPRAVERWSISRHNSGADSGARHGRGPEPWFAAK